MGVKSLAMGYYNDAISICDRPMSKIRIDAE